MMSKKKRGWKQTGSTRRITDRNTFFHAVTRAEQLFGARASKDEHLHAGESLTLLALCTLAVLDGKEPHKGDLQVSASEEEISRTAVRIITDPYYSPGATFPYTKEEMAQAFVQGVQALMGADTEEQQDTAHALHQKMAERQPAEIWIPEDEVWEQFEFIQKLHPGQSLDETLENLKESGFISIRVNPSTGKRELRFNEEQVQAAIDALPPEKRTGKELKIYEGTAKICEYHHDATTLLSVIEQQTGQLRETEEIPWITISHEQLVEETLGDCDDLAEALAFLETKRFIEIAEYGPTTYRYRLNTHTVQAALDALPTHE